MAITNVLFNQGMVQQIKTGATAVTVQINPAFRWRLKHTGLEEDMSTGDVNGVYFTLKDVDGAALATVTAASTGALGRGFLVVQANNPEMAKVEFGPGIDYVSVIRAAGAPVVQLEPVRS